MTNNVWLVYSNPVSPDREEEYNLWYNDFHLRQMLKLPGFVAATRYRISRVQTEWYPPMVNQPEWPYGKDRYLAIYEIDRALDPAEVLATVRDTDKLRLSADPASDPIAWGEQWFFEAYAGRERTFGLRPDTAPASADDDRPHAIWLVPTTPISEEIENEYHKWYNLQGVLRNPGFEAISRYKLSKVQGSIDSRAQAPGGEWPYGRHHYLAIWEVSDLHQAWSSRRRGRDTPRQAGAAAPQRYAWMANWPSLHHADEHIFYEPVTRRAVSPWLDLRG
jgi:hypothetical protein